MNPSPHATPAYHARLRETPLQSALAALVGLGAGVAGYWLWRKLPPHAATLEEFRRTVVDTSTLLMIAGAVIVSVVGARIASAVFISITAKPKAPQTASRITPHKGRRTTQRRLAITIAALLASALFVHHVCVSKMESFDNVATFWLDDDMMISLRYARNLAQGFGAVWNPGQPAVEGYSNPLWMLTMTLPFLCGAALEHAAAYVLLFNFIGLLGVLAIGARVARRMGLRPLAVALALLLIAGNRWVVYWAAGGAETVMTSLLLMLIANQFLRAAQPVWNSLGLSTRPSSRLGFGTGLMIGLLALVRADTLIPALCLLMLWWGMRITQRQTPPLATHSISQFTLRAAPLAWLPALILPLAHFLWRHAYYGKWFPNTYYLRIVNVPTRPMFGSFYALVFVGLFGPMLLLALIAAIASPGGRALGIVRRALAALPLLMLAYCVYAGGDELPEYRFVAPYVPLLIIAGVGAASRLLLTASRLRPTQWLASPSLRFAALVAILGLASLQSLALPGTAMAAVRVRGASERNNVAVGLLLKKYTRPSALIAHDWAGAAPYFSERPALDMLGKSDAVIAHGEARPDEYQPGHNKYNADYLYSRAPDVIVAGLSGLLARDPQAMAASPARAAYPPLFKLLETPQFIADYRDNLVQTQFSMDYHGIFIRKGSTLADAPDKWKSDTYLVYK